MESLRLLKITYRQKWTPNRLRVSDRALPPASFRVGEFDASLENGIWVFVPRADFYSEESARAALEPLLRDWETEWDLVHNLRVTFDFDDCVFEQPTRVEGEPFAVSGKLTVKEVSLTASYAVALSQYPVPPSFTVHSSPLVARLRARWHEIEVGRDSLLAGAYWFLTTFETEFGGSRRSAAKNLVVEYAVLSKLGDLTARNDPIKGRKNKGPIALLSDDERAWVRDAVKTLMRRAVEVRSGHSGLTPITINDLPKL